MAVTMLEAAFKGRHPIITQRLGNPGALLFRRMQNVPARRELWAEVSGRNSQHAIEGIAGVQQAPLLIQNVDAVTGMLQNHAAASVGAVAGSDLQPE